MPVMSSVTVDEDSIDEILYLARANESSELETFLAGLSSQTKHSKADLVTAAVDPHSKNSALHYAAANGHTDVIKLLLSYKHDNATAPTLELINKINDAGNTALHWAALNGHLECVKQLIGAGADVTIINKAGHDAVFEAEINDKKEVVDWLLETVEELEKGIGGETSEGAGNGDNDNHDESQGADVEDENSTSGAGTGVSAGDIENARKQMEGMKTTDGNAQGG